MNVKTRLVVSTTVVLALALAALAVVISTVAAGQAREDGLRYAGSLAESEAERVEAGVLRQLQTAHDLGSTLSVLAAGRKGDRVVADAVQPNCSRPIPACSACGPPSSPTPSTAGTPLT